MIDKGLAGFLREGVSIHLATRNERLEPNGTRVAALAVDEDGTHITAYVPVAGAQAVRGDLDANGQAAIMLGRPIDHRTYQLKGVFAGARDATADERTLVAEQWERLLVNLEQIGLSRPLSAAWVTWPCVAIRIKVTALFNQTPGPGAGASLV